MNSVCFIYFFFIRVIKNLISYVNFTENNILSTDCADRVRMAGMHRLQEEAKREDEKGVRVGEESLRVTLWRQNFKKKRLRSFLKW